MFSVWSSVSNWPYIVSVHEANSLFDDEFMHKLPTLCTVLACVLCVASAPYVPPPYQTDSIQKDNHIEQDKPIPW